ALEARGKRMRPALVLLAGTFGDYNLNRLVPLGAAIELLHTASLVHDDVVDGAASRRGRPTANHVFDNALTVLLGDYMFANAAEMVTRTGSLHVTRLFALTLMKMTSGELDQDAAAFDVSKDVQDYLWRIGGKTASLFANATEGGASLAGCDTETVDALRGFGYDIGMAFQIVDDILDFASDDEQLGKPAGSDLREGTITLPALLLMEEKPRDNPIKKFFTAQRGREQHLQDAIAMVRSSGVLETSMDLAREYVRRASEQIADLPDSEGKRCLLEVGQYVLEREN
ncbi:MAG TPA: polyprenyl synthetase family protein, partial [Tepidiformaceae bacterium]|nr:polyprenyl synthetase family protein [Tepidiformaceae bacterium]